MKKNVGLAFTLAEVMIVLIVIGILIAVLLPFARQLTPSEEIIKFQKANQALMTGIKSLVEENGDLGLGKNGEVITNPKYFCNALANLMNVKSVNCSDDNLGYNTSAAAFMEDFAADKFSDGNSLMDTADCICKNYTTSGEEIVLGDGTIFYTVNPYYHFGFKNPEDHSRVFTTKTTEKQYKYMCIDIDGIGKGQDPFGYAISTDGKIILGSRASIWVNKDMQGEIPNGDEISSIDSCPLVYYNEGACGLAATKITLNGAEYCITKYNIGDHSDLPLPSSVILVNAGDTCYAEEDNCCWSGVTTGVCDTVNGEYGGCNRTVCNWFAANEICSKLTYKGKNWSLMTTEQMTALHDMGANEITKNLGADGLQLCDLSSGYYSAQCAKSYVCIGAYYDECAPSYFWGEESDVSGDAEFMALTSGEFSTPGAGLNFHAMSVRCIAPLD
ncbi:MAG: hypothetical protein IKU37_10205 [Candidatus Gastranaerophilales bacterium]|nr:hypothetical protein [Candidatus Gastranaerophilales bacterium]